jgi:hypothetical protein
VSRALRIVRVAVEEGLLSARCGVDGCASGGAGGTSLVAGVAAAEVSSIQAGGTVGALVGAGSFTTRFRAMDDVTVGVGGANTTSLMRRNETDDVEAQTARGSVTKAATSSAAGRRFAADGPAVWRSSASRAR